MLDLDTRSLGQRFFEVLSLNCREIFLRGLQDIKGH